MKSFYIAICICFAIIGPCYSQLIFNPSVIGSAGGTTTAAGWVFSSQVGELVIQTRTNGNIIFTQGFEQATLDICNGLDDDFDNLIDEDGTPIIDPVSNVIVCNGAMTGTILFTGNTPGAVYNWTNNTPAIGLAASGSGNITAFTAVNSGITPIVATVTVTPSFTMGATTCIGLPVSFTITVNPSPTAVATPSSQTICSGQTITTIALSANISGTAYSWTRNNTVTVTGMSASGSGDISGSLTNTTNGPVTVTFTVTPTVNGCSGATTTATVMVNPTPNAVATPSSQQSCSGQATTPIILSGSVSGTVFNWTRNNTGTVTGMAASGSGNISGILTNPTNAPVTVTFTITPTANSCPGVPITSTVIVNPTPNAVATPASQTICSGSAITTIVLSGAVSGTTYSWTRDNIVSVTGIAASGTGNIIGTFTNTTSAPITISFTITPTANGCPGPTTTAMVLVNPTPNVVATPSSQTICSGSTITTISLSGMVSGTSFAWTRNNTASVTGIASVGSGNISGGLINTTSTPIMVTFTITPTANGCPGPSTSATVLVNPIPNVIATPPSQTICSGQPIANIVLSGNVSGTTFTWTRDNTGTVTGILPNGSGDIMGSLTNTTTSPITVTFTITPTASTCSGPPISATVIVNPKPDLFAMPLFQTICSGQTITPISIFGNVSGTIFNWTRDNNATVTGIAASGNGDISGSLTNTTNATVVVTFTVTPVANGCSGSPFTIPITVRPTPNAVATPPSQTVCSGQTIATIAFSGNVSGTVYSWSRNNTGTVTGIAATGSGDISGSLTNTTLAPVLVTFSVTPLINGCPGPTIFPTVLVNPTSTATATPSSQTICSGQTITTIALSANISGTTYTWSRNNTVPVTGIAASGSGDISGSLTNTTNGPVTVTFTIIPTVNGCSGATTTATVLVNPTPNAVATPSSQQSCSGQAITPIILSGSVSGTVFNWTRNNTGTVTGMAASGSGNISGILTNPTNAPVTVTFTITPTANSCPGVPITATVTVNPIPNAVAVPPSQSICSGQPISTIVLSGNVSGTVFNWTRNNTGQVSGIAASGSGNIGGVLSSISTAPVTVTFTITPVANGCSGFPIIATVTVNPIPNVYAMPLFQTICSEQAITPISFISDYENTTYNWTRNNNGTVTGIAASGSGDISGTLTNTTNSTVVVTFTITPVALGCVGSATTVSVTVRPKPDAIATPASQTICSGQSITNIVLSGGVVGTNFAWTRNNTVTVTGIAASGSGDIAGSLTNTTTAPITVTFTITPSANTCTGNPITASVIVNPTPNALATPSSQTICSGQTITTIALSGNVSGTVFNWTRNNTGTVTGIGANGSGNITGALTNTTSAPITVTFTITPTANGCPGTAITVTVLVNPTPNAIATPPTQTICSGQPISSVVLSGSVSGSLFNWTRDNTGTVTGMTASGAGNINGALTNTTNAPITVTFTINPSANGCSGSSITATVLVNPAPLAFSVNGGGSYCIPADPGVLVGLSGSQANVSYQLKLDGSNVGVAVAGTGSAISFGIKSGTGNYTVVATHTMGGCTSNMTGSVNITSYNCSIAIIDPCACKNNATTLTNGQFNETIAVSAPSGQTWSVSVNSGLYQTSSPTPPGSPIIIPNGFLLTEVPQGGGVSNYILMGVHVDALGYNITVTNGFTSLSKGSTCYYPNPQINGLNNAYCANDPAVTLNGTAQLGNGGGAATGTGSFKINNLAATQFNPVSLGAGTHTIVFTFDAADGVPNSSHPGCTQAVSQQVIVNPTPTVTIQPDITISNCVNVPQITFAGSIPGTVFTWTRTSEGIGATLNGTQFVPAFNATNSGATPLTSTFTVTPSMTSNGITCTGNPITFKITVTDIVPPVFSGCPANITINCNDVVPPVATPTASDACDASVTISFTTSTTKTSNGSCSDNNYTITRIWTATDNFLNTSVCSQIITVRDVTPPSITCPAPVTVSCAALVPAANIAGVTTSDNCGGTITVIHVGDVISNQTCANKFTVTRTYRATDVCGNSANCTQIITVNDITVPNIACPAAQTVSCSQLVPVPSIASVSASDNCAGGITVTFVNDIISNQTCTNKFTVTRTYRADDVCGNTSTCTQTITVNDIVPPVINGVPANITIECTAPVPPVPNVTATDLCTGTVSLTFNETNNKSPFEQVCAYQTYTITRLWVATDACGNTTSRIMTIRIQDTKAPTFKSVPPAFITVSCDDDNANNVDPVPVDACDLTPAMLLDISYKFNPNGCSNSYVATYTWTAGDNCGNTINYVQKITVEDKTPPVILCPSNITVTSLKAVPVSWQAPKAQDNCDGAIPVKQISGPVSGSTFQPNSKTTIVYSAVDECGNVSTCSFSVTIKSTAIKGLVISGEIKDKKENLISNVQVMLSGDLSQFSSGSKFGFEDLDIGANFEITPSKTDGPLNGVNTLDMVFLTNHILGKKSLDSPYKIFAGDVNNSKTLTTGDLVKIRQLILHITDKFEDVDSWEFLPATTTFIDPYNPWKNTILSSLKFNNIQVDQKADFRGVKMGDVTWDAVGTATGNIEVKSNQVSLLNAQDQIFEKGDQVELVVGAKTLNELLGLQFTMEFDKSILELDNIIGLRKDVGSDNFGLRFLDKGLITGSINFDAVQGDELFTVKFKAKQSGQLSKLIKLNSALTPSEAYIKAAEVTALQLNFTKGANDVVSTPQLLQNEPNPFENTTLISFLLPQSQEATISIFDLEGKLVKEFKEVYQKGRNEININKTDLLSAGVYYYQLKTNDFVDVKKMMFIR